MAVGRAVCSSRCRAVPAGQRLVVIVLTEDQLAALEKAKLEKEAHGQIKTEHPGYLGAQDTFYVGTLSTVWLVAPRDPSNSVLRGYSTFIHPDSRSQPSEASGNRARTHP